MRFFDQLIFAVIFIACSLCATEFEYMIHDEPIAKFLAHWGFNYDGPYGQNPEPFNERSFY